MARQHPAPNAALPRYEHQTIRSLISEARFDEFLKASSNDSVDALELYEWSSRMAAALFEMIGHVEVVLRNSVDQTLARELQEKDRHVPWFLLNLPRVTADIRRDALSYSDLSTDRDSILANLTLGFWKTLLEQPEMWRQASGAFQEGTKQLEVVQRVQRMHTLRNRLAHHAPVLEVDVPGEVANALVLMELVHPHARLWLESIEGASALYDNLPVSIPDTVLVPAKKAWPNYHQTHAYVCQVGRYFRPVERIAFYESGVIHSMIPKIVAHFDSVDWSSDEAARLMVSPDPDERRLGKVIQWHLENGWDNEQYQVFLLTGPKDKGFSKLARDIPHNGTGRGSAFVHKQRYFHMKDLRKAQSTADLPVSYFLNDVTLPDPQTGITEEGEAEEAGQ